MDEAFLKPTGEFIAPKRRVVFGLSHWWAFLVCWFPLNPLVLHYFSQFFRQNFAVTIPDKLAYLGLLCSTICGPFTAILEGRNRDFCWQVAWQLLPVCLGVLLFAGIVQIFWQPRSRWGSACRLLIWMCGCFVWFAGAIISIFANSG